MWLWTGVYKYLKGKKLFGSLTWNAERRFGILKVEKDRGTFTYLITSICCYGTVFCKVSQHIARGAGTKSTEFRSYPALPANEAREQKKKFRQISGVV